MPLTIYLVTLNDGTDEIINIGCTTALTFEPAQTTAQAVREHLHEHFRDEIEDQLEEDPADRYDPAEVRFYLPTLFDPQDVCDRQNSAENNCNVLYFKEAEFMPLEDATQVVEALRRLPNTLSPDNPGPQPS